VFVHRLRASPVSRARRRDDNAAMSAPELESYSIGEFVTYKLVKDPQTKTFTITLNGPLDYALLIAHKVANLTVSSEELEELPAPVTALPLPTAG
jgi:hypothetical protein